MSAVNRARAGKYAKPKRGGGKHFSRDLQPVNDDGEVMSMWGEQNKKPTKNADSEDDDDDEDSDDDDESDDSATHSSGPADPGAGSTALSREDRKAAAKARKEAGKARANHAGAVQPGDLPSSEDESSDDDDGDMPSNPNHTAKARTQAATPRTVDEEEAAAAKKKPGSGTVEPLSRRERDERAKELSRKAYEKRLDDGTTEKAMEEKRRLEEVKVRRAAATALKKAEEEEKNERDKARQSEFQAREQKLREAAMGPASGKRGGRGGKRGSRA